jgi:hypothetical protein
VAYKYSTVAITALVAATIAYGIYYALGQSHIALAAAGGTSSTTQTTGHRVSVSYTVPQTVIVPPNTNKTAVAFCQKDDALISGGYSMAFGPVNVSPPNIVIAANTPTLVQGGSAKYQGWQVELVNLGNSDVKITSNALCVGFRIAK